MSGSVKILVQLGPNCDPNKPTTRITLSGTAEPNGGDHYANISWARTDCITYLLEIAEDSYVPAPSSFLFTSAGETYTILATAGCPPQLLGTVTIPYYVSAVYAPAWANVHDEADGNLIIIEPDYCCDVPQPSDGVKATVNTTSADTIGADGSYANHLIPGSPGCVAQSLLQVGAGTTINTTRTFDTGSYKWFENAYTLAGTATVSTSLGGSANVSVTLTKPANSFVCAINIVCGTVLAPNYGTVNAPAEDCPEALPTCTYPVGTVNNLAQIATNDLLCSTKKLKVYGLVTAVLNMFAKDAADCCICTQDGANMSGWFSTMTLANIQIKVE